MRNPGSLRTVGARTLVSAVALSAIVSVAACGSGGGEKSAGSGVDLKISYQTADFPELLKASGLFNNLSYSYQVPIINGPANQLAALYGKQIDVGEAGDNTGAFEAANSISEWTVDSRPIASFAVHHTPGAVNGAVTVYASKQSGIRSLQDLKGKKIGYNYGGNIYAGYVYLLSQAGLGPKDVQGVQFPANQAAANAFDAGHLDAVVTTYTQVKKRVDSGDALKVADTPTYGAISGGGWLARTDSLKDPAKLAALKDFFGRLRKFYEQWVPANEEAYKKVEKTVLNQTDDIATINWENAAKTHFYPIGPKLYAIEQKIVDSAYKFGGLKRDSKAELGYTEDFNQVTVG